MITTTRDRRIFDEAGKPFDQLFYGFLVDAGPAESGQTLVDLCREIGEANGFWLEPHTLDTWHTEFRRVAPPDEFRDSWPIIEWTWKAMAKSDAEVLVFLDETSDPNSFRMFPLSSETGIIEFLWDQFRYLVVGIDQTSGKPRVRGNLDAQHFRTFLSYASGVEDQENWLAEGIDLAWRCRFDTIATETIGDYWVRWTISDERDGDDAHNAMMFLDRRKWSLSTGDIVELKLLFSAVLELHRWPDDK